MKKYCKILAVVAIVISFTLLDITNPVFAALPSQVKYVAGGLQVGNRTFIRQGATQTFLAPGSGCRDSVTLHGLSQGVRKFVYNQSTGGVGANCRTIPNWGFANTLTGDIARYASCVGRSPGRSMDACVAEAIRNGEPNAGPVGPGTPDGPPQGPGGDLPPGDDTPGDDTTGPNPDPGEDEPERYTRPEQLECDADADGFLDPNERQCVRDLFENSAAVPENLQCDGGGIQISVGIGGDDCIDSGNGSIESNPIITIMKAILRVVTAGVGLVVVAMIVIAGIQYVTSQGNPQMTAEAKNRLMNAIIGLIMYVFSFALLNFLVPGGLIGG